MFSVALVLIGLGFPIIAVAESAIEVEPIFAGVANKPVEAPLVVATYERSVTVARIEWRERLPLETLSEGGDSRGFENELFLQCANVGDETPTCGLLDGANGADVLIVSGETYVMLQHGAAAQSCPNDPGSPRGEGRSISPMPINEIRSSPGDVFRESGPKTPDAAAPRPFQI